MQLLDGKTAALAVKNRIKTQTASLLQAGKKQPHLAAILVGSNGASETYVANKIKSCAEVGFKSSLIRLPETAEEKTVIEAIEKLNQDDDVDGILVQLPLPAHIHEQKIINLVDPDKDVDGFHPINIGK